MGKCWNKATLLAVLLLAAGTAFAQPYPSKPVRIIVPYAGGGPGDILARLIAQKMSESYGQPVLVENRAGANGIIASEAVAKSPPDGYTVFQAIDFTLCMNQSLYSKLPYDPLKDFAPVALIATVPGVIVVTNALGVNSIAELIALAKSKPGELFFGAGGTGTQLAGELFNSMAGIKMAFVAYKGGNTTITALLGGEVPVIVDGITTTLPQWRAGKVKALAVTSGKRSANAPELPTVAEAGLPGYEMSTWQSMVVPAGTPREVIHRLNADFGRILKLPDVRERLLAIGIEPTHSTPEELGGHIRSESEKWGKVIRDIGLKMQ
jgi:tripartite-type tricarboxylate transporter receptor subunit TctC